MTTVQMCIAYYCIYKTQIMRVGMSVVCRVVLASHIGDVNKCACILLSMRERINERRAMDVDHCKEFCIYLRYHVNTCESYL